MKDVFVYYDIGMIREIGSIAWVSHGENGGLIDPGHYNVCLQMRLEVGSQSERGDGFVANAHHIREILLV